METVEQMLERGRQQIQEERRRIAAAQEAAAFALKEKQDRFADGFKLAVLNLIPEALRPSLEFPEIEQPHWEYATRPDAKANDAELHIPGLAPILFWVVAGYNPDGTVEKVWIAEKAVSNFWRVPAAVYEDPQDYYDADEVYPGKTKWDWRVEYCATFGVDDIHLALAKAEERYGMFQAFEAQRQPHYDRLVEERKQREAQRAARQTANEDKPKPQPTIEERFQKEFRSLVASIIDDRLSYLGLTER